MERKICNGHFNDAIPALKWGGSGGHKKVGTRWGGTPKPQSGGALFKKVQKWGGTRSSAPPLPGLKYTPERWGLELSTLFEVTKKMIVIDYKKQSKF